MMAALASNLLCLRYSRIWLVNMIVLAIVIVASLAMVGSMTSLSMILVFLVCCLLPTSKLRLTAICGLFAVFLLFQIFVVFNGRGLENNELAVYIVEDVLKKDLTFTYRTHMWESALKIIEKSPIWGWGFADADWFKANMTAFAIGPHNFILSILIHGGVILLSIYIMVLFALSRTPEESDASESYRNQCWKEFMVLSIVVCSYIISFLCNSSLHFVIFRSLLTAALSFIISLFQNDRI